MKVNAIINKTTFKKIYEIIKRSAHSIHHPASKQGMNHDLALYIASIARFKF
jgi:hypothetical protein